MGPLAAAGFHLVAPDQRGYGRTAGWDRSYDGDVASFRLFNLVRDALGLVAALGYRSVWRGHRMIAIGFITFAWLVAGAAIETSKNNQNAEATEFSGSRRRPTNLNAPNVCSGAGHFGRSAPRIAW